MDKYVILLNKAGIPTGMAYDKVAKGVVPCGALLTDADANYIPEKPKAPELPKKGKFRNFMDEKQGMKKIGTFMLISIPVGVLAYFVCAKWIFKKEGTTMEGGGVVAPGNTGTPNINV